MHTLLLNAYPCKNRILVVCGTTWNILTNHHIHALKHNAALLHLDTLLLESSTHSVAITQTHNEACDENEAPLPLTISNRCADSSMAYLLLTNPTKTSARLLHLCDAEDITLELAHDILDDDEDGETIRLSTFSLPASIAL